MAEERKPPTVAEALQEWRVAERARFNEASARAKQRDR